MNPLTIQRFGTLSVRTLDLDGTPWFVAADVAQALEYREAWVMTRLLADDEAAPHIVWTRSASGVAQRREVTIINEPGLYRAIFSSRSPKAEPFRRWVFHEVLPSIRKTGGYSEEDMTEHGRIVADRRAYDIYVRHNRDMKAKDAEIQALKDQMQELLHTLG